MDEKRIIENLLSGMEKESQPFYVKAWFSVVLWVVLVGAFYGFAWMIDHDVNNYITLVGSCLLGGACGFFSFMKNSEKACPVVKQHLNRESLEKRLKELNA